MKRLTFLAALFFSLPGGNAKDPEAMAPGGLVPVADASQAATPTGKYLLYIHPKIVEDQGLPAVSPEHGEFQYDAILDYFRSHGFTVISELRPKDADAGTYAQRSLVQIDELLAAGVDPWSITVVGASKGSYIASLVSHLARNPSINYVLLAGCNPDTVAHMRSNNMDLYGNVLAIRDVADTRWAGSCAEVFAFSPGVRRHKEIVLSVGTGHGVIFEPLEGWVRPTRDWADSPH